MKLYGSHASPYARKVRVVVHEKQLSVELVAVETAADPRITALNPLGKIPVFERDDGSILFDSPVIVEYLDALATPALIPVAGEARWRALRWAALGDGIMDAAVTRVLEARRPEALRSTDVMKLQEGKIARAMAFAERELPDGPWLVEHRLSIADIALGAALEYVDFRYPHDWRHTSPRLAKWLTGVSARPAFMQTQPPK